MSPNNQEPKPFEFGVGQHELPEEKQKLIESTKVQIEAAKSEAEKARLRQDLIKQIGIPLQHNKATPEQFAVIRATVDTKGFSINKLNTQQLSYFKDKLEAFKAYLELIEDRLVADEIAVTPKKKQVFSEMMKMLETINEEQYNQDAARMEKALRALVKSGQNSEAAKVYRREYSKCSRSYRNLQQFIYQNQASITKSGGIFQTALAMQRLTSLNDYYEVVTQGDSAKPTTTVYDFETTDTRTVDERVKKTPFSATDLLPVKLEDPQATKADIESISDIEGLNSAIKQMKEIALSIQVALEKNPVQKIQERFGRENLQAFIELRNKSMQDFLEFVAVPTLKKAEQIAAVDKFALTSVITYFKKLRKSQDIPNVEMEAILTQIKGFKYSKALVKSAEANSDLQKYQGRVEAAKAKTDRLGAAATKAQEELKDITEEWNAELEIYSAKESAINDIESKITSLESQLDQYSSNVYQIDQEIEGITDAKTQINESLTELRSDHILGPSDSVSPMQILTAFNQSKASMGMAIQNIPRKNNSISSKIETFDNALAELKVLEGENPREVYERFSDDNADVIQIINEFETTNGSQKGQTLNANLEKPYLEIPLNNSYTELAVRNRIEELFEVKQDELDAKVRGLEEEKTEFEINISRTLKEKNDQQIKLDTLTIELKEIDERIKTLSEQMDLAEVASTTATHAYEVQKAITDQYNEAIELLIRDAQGQITQSAEERAQKAHSKDREALEKADRASKIRYGTLIGSRVRLRSASDVSQIENVKLPKGTNFTIIGEGESFDSGSKTYDTYKIKLSNGREYLVAKDFVTEFEDLSQTHLKEAEFKTGKRVYLRDVYGNNVTDSKGNKILASADRASDIKVSSKSMNLPGQKAKYQFIYVVYKVNGQEYKGYVYDQLIK